MINAYFFLLLKLLHAITKSCQINCRIEEQRHAVKSFFVKIKYYMDKVSSWEFCNKNIEFTFKIFRMKIFHIYNLKSQGRTRLSLITLLSFGFKKKPPKNSSSERFFCKTQVFIKWFTQTQFLAIIKTRWFL